MQKPSGTLSTRTVRPMQHYHVRGSVKDYGSRTMGLGPLVLMILLSITEHRNFCSIHVFKTQDKYTCTVNRVYAAREFCRSFSFQNLTCIKIKLFSENKTCEATFVTTLQLINVLNDVWDRHLLFHCDFFHSFSLRSCW